MILDYLPILIPVGFALFILRAQLLRVGIGELGMENLHASKPLGAISGWLGLGGAAVLAVAAFISGGIVWGLVLITGGMALGIILSAVALPVLGSTLLLGHHGGEGNKSIAEFNRRYGPYFALAVAGIAAVCVYAIMTFRLF
jgi:hypothetical protein